METPLKLIRGFARGIALIAGVIDIAVVGVITASATFDVFPVKSSIPTRAQTQTYG
jgi:hypothetical protein